ncbi:MAG: hypothetical protein KKB08_13800 [Gammaproteobacteria bacterium]|nr:hypothetical protein [Gammaproteobacteria bacterium]MBU1817819.1 hypothetical protein [Gammaproteobacteria bacterium]
MKQFENLLLRLGDKVMLLAIGVWVLAFAGIFAGAWRLRGVWIFYVFVTLVLVALVKHWTQSVRRRHIRETPLPRFLQRKLRETYPHLSPRDCELVERGLRQFFLACLRSNRQFVAMPSKAVDALWHEFILHTQAYKLWCRDALGFFLHHTPAEALGKKARHNDGLRRAWYWACKEESIDPKAPSRLPLLFALDAKFAIAGGFTYVPDCADIARKSDAGGCGGGTHCGTSFSDGSHSGSSGDFGGADSSDGGADGGGDGGGCGGGGD